MLIIKGKNTHIKCYCNQPESGALDQAKNLAELPFLHQHVALMPDTHQGYGMPIGGVIATKGVVIPNAVGVDIGCGMCAVKTSLTDITIDQLKEIMGKIREYVPVGRNWNTEPCSINDMPYLGSRMTNNPFSVVCGQFGRARQQLGSLGGGNHFIEIQKGRESINDAGNIWIMIHSGSRNLGKQVADHYNKLAKELNKKWESSVPASYDLAFLPIDSQVGQDYLLEMQYCVDFALANRTHMMETILGIFDVVFDFKMENEPMINIAHNYATMENHFGKNVMVHRKGATSAKEGEIGIIPGSQGTASYIVKGKGNRDSFKSCSHGAGRTMSRSKARAELSLDKEKELLDNKGIVHSIRNVNDLDEASGAYKDIDVVMEEQKDLVDIVVKLQPLGVVKG